MKRRLRVAVSNLIADEWRLLTTRTTDSDAPVSGRPVAFASGWHSKSLVERSWDVDCEYNRRGTDEFVGYKRVLTRRPNAGPDDEPPVVLPDIIVHRRGLTGATDNLLVLELKTNRSVQARAGGSVQSILEIQHKTDYHHAVFLDLRLSGGAPRIDPHWTWFAASTSGTPGPERVYRNQLALDAVILRGADEERRRYR